MRNCGPSLIIALGHKASSCVIWHIIGPYPKHCLGLLSYYSRFLPNMSSNLAPLNQLLHNQAEWVWGDKEKQSFQLSKRLLLSSQTLDHFDPVILQYMELVQYCLINWLMAQKNLWVFQLRKNILR